MDHYNRYEEDLDLLKNAGLNAFRFTIEWARIEPEEGIFDETALKHYQNVIQACKKRDILPIVTLHHFSSPAWLIHKGGWKNEDTVELFARYCRKIAEAFKDDLKYICTINEANMGMQMKKIMDQYKNQTVKTKEHTEGPQVGLNHDAGMEHIMLGIREAAEAFGRPDVNTFLDGRNAEQETLVMRAHQASRKAIKSVLPDGKVGLTLSLFDIQILPGGESKAEKLWYEDFGFYLPYLQEDDFIGVQNYTRKIVAPEGEIAPEKDTIITDAGYE